MLGEDVTDTLAYRHRNGCDLIRDVDDLLVIFTVNRDDVHLFLLKGLGHPPQRYSCDMTCSVTERRELRIKQH